jgi:hypothetical protein
LSINCLKVAPYGAATYYISKMASQILFRFQNDPGKEWPIADILKIARKPKKEVNAELYKLQRQNLVEKVQETPPVWKLVGCSTSVTGGFVSSDISDWDSQNYDSETIQSAQQGGGTMSTRLRCRVRSPSRGRT